MHLLIESEVSLMQIRENTAIQYEVIADCELVQHALVGDQQAFEALANRYSASLFNFIYHFFGDYDQACDIYQQVLLQLYLSLTTIRANKPLKYWLFQVARNRCIDELRRRRVAHFSELELDNDEDEYSMLFAIPDVGPLPEELAEQHEVQERLCQAIRVLPPKFRSIVALRYLSQMTFSEIGERLSIPEATAKTYFQRAKPLLRACLREGEQYQSEWR